MLRKAFMIVAALVVAWVVVSWVDVMLHNMESYVYPAWNYFGLLARI